jgi:hypothetical protein
MPKRSKIETEIPLEKRRELEEKLKNNSFSGFQELSDWFSEIGFSISRSSIGRFSKKFQQRIETIKLVTEQAAAINELLPDDSNLLGDAASRMAQSLIFEILMKLEASKDPEDIEIVTDLSRAIAALNRVAISQKKFMDAMKEKIKPEVEEIRQEMKQKGLSDESADFLCAKFLKIVD